MRRGIATFELDWGKCPPWLFEKMVRLSRSLIEVIIKEFSPEEFIKRISDPVWFQSFGNLLAFDWNSSGLTTTLTGALKQAIKEREKEYKIFICGGKGKTSRKTPEEILNWGEKIGFEEKQIKKLIYTSKMSAKVDSALVQDNYQIYHHCFIFSAEDISHHPKIKSWAVIQQGMNLENQTARRYHWFSEKTQNLIVEPHTAIISENVIKKPVLNMTANKSEENRKTSVALMNSSPKRIFSDIKILDKYSYDLVKMTKVIKKEKEFTNLNLKRGEFKYHQVLKENFSKSKYLLKILSKLLEEKPQNYENLLATEGVGPKTIRALSLVSEIIYNAPLSWKDPARYSFAHGGKDGTPYPVDKKTYNQTINFLETIVRKSKISPYEKDKILYNKIKIKKLKKEASFLKGGSNDK